MRWRAFFVEPLEAWRKAMGFDRIVLLGHSMGGHLSVSYALRYPEHVERLILASSAGLSQKPDASEEHPPRLAVRALAALSSRGLHPMMLAWMSARCLLFRRFMIRKFFNMFRSASWLPHDLLVEYHYQSWTCGYISGGHWLSAAMDLEGGARRPVSEHLGKLRVPHVTLIFGTDDYNLQHAPHAVSLLRKAHVQCQILTVQDGGHTMQVSNPLGFAEAVSMSGSCCAEGRVFGREALLKEFGGA
eukprot:gnl/TRDRNA2_/TRDRNA2_163815_c0_seq1.p1 gnl/TRDRNA2_/TRDRNA2_163815_c0~~gnl/TRDRNA2_/TRDRNA2_163815_c0_seq1.p1  ORF type:complete len:245 (-),score=28.62 gnl/TRDRNA2_/TRDRNA2_163815_c0_seq1:84-818(-)